MANANNMVATTDGSKKQFIVVKIGSEQYGIDITYIDNIRCVQSDIIKDGICELKNGSHDPHKELAFCVLIDLQYNLIREIKISSRGTRIGGQTTIISITGPIDIDSKLDAFVTKETHFSTSSTWLVVNSTNLSGVRL